MQLAFVLATLFSVFVVFSSGRKPDRVFEYNKAEKYSDYWYKAANDEIQSSLKIERIERVAKSAILFLGDGMSIPTLTASRIFKGQRKGRAGEGENLFFEKFPHSSLIKTYNVDRQVPDSAGTATAFLCGVKANYQTLGVNAHVTDQEKDCSSITSNSVPSILKWASDSGKSTGIVTTARVTHATPAASYAHVAHRDWESSVPEELQGSQCKDIARQLIENEPGNKFKVILGGGRRHFLPANWVDPREHKFGSRKDGLNLVERWISARKAEGLNPNQYKFVNSTHGLDNINIEDTEFVLGLFNYSHLAYESDRDKSGDGEPSLTDMTRTAIKILEKNQNGFVLLVEGGRIDHAHHNNFAATALSETIQFDEAIEVASKMIDPSDTLVVVTADHAHTMTINGYPIRGNDILGISTSDNDTYGQPFTTLLYGNGPGHTEPRTLPEDTRNAKYRQFSAVHLNESNHGGDDVALFATGPFAHLFHGLQEQSYIAHVISYATCIGRYQDEAHCPSVTSAAYQRVGLFGVRLNVTFILTSLILFNRLLGGRIFVNAQERATTETVTERSTFHRGETFNDAPVDGVGGGGEESGTNNYLIYIIVGSVLAAILLLVLIILGVLYCVNHCKGNKSSSVSVSKSSSKQKMSGGKSPKKEESVGHDYFESIVKKRGDAMPVKSISQYRKKPAPPQAKKAPTPQKKQSHESTGSEYYHQVNKANVRSISQYASVKRKP